VSKEATFEKDMARLETLVEKLEQEDLGLEESLKAFEEGMKLSDTLTKALEKAQKRVMKLIRDNDGAPVLEEFDADEEEN
jgi:exodeoxyribonuclease VII small subunit